MRCPTLGTDWQAFELGSGTSWLVSMSGPERDSLVLELMQGRGSQVFALRRGKD